MVDDRGLSADPIRLSSNGLIGGKAMKLGKWSRVGRIFQTLFWGAVGYGLIAQTTADFAGPFSGLGGVYYCIVACLNYWSIKALIEAITGFEFGLRRDVRQDAPASP
jgi:hypothetical protein